MPKRSPAFYDDDSCDIAAFENLLHRKTTRVLAPQSSEILHNIPVYDMAALRANLAENASRQTLMGEWAAMLSKGPGVIILRGAYDDTAPIDAATAAYDAIIAQEKAAGGSEADHFAASGHNDRIWNSLQKLAETAPDAFVAYFANPVIDAACEAWLGPYYQMTAQINLVHPGGAAQTVHRDYHLGFQTAETSARFPSHVHDLSPLMTLQGGIAHVDMSVESGPTKLLPFSQMYGPGYAAFRREEFQTYFEDHFVQCPMAKGDALFFNPALFHAAGENRSTDVHRMVNLLQVSSAFGRTMETINRVAMCKKIYAPLTQAWADKTLDEAGLDAVIAASAEGYAFPTNLDRDPPIGGLAPQSQQALLREAVTQDWDAQTFGEKLDEQDTRKQA